MVGSGKLESLFIVRFTYPKMATDSRNHCNARGSIGMWSRQTTLKQCSYDFNLGQWELCITGHILIYGSSNG